MVSDVEKKNKKKTYLFKHFISVPIVSLHFHFHSHKRSGSALRFLNPNAAKLPWLGP